MTAEEIKEDICRLCLKFGNDTFSDFSDLSSKEKLKNVLPELNVDNPSDFVICTRCKTSLTDACQFAQTFSKNDEFIRKEKKRLKIVNGINLNRIVKKSGGGVKNDMNDYLCRICLKSKVGKYTNLNKLYTDKYFSSVLESCLPKLDKQLTLDPVICEICQKKLRETYSFKLDCMIVEKKILGYSSKSPDKEVDLNRVLNFLNTPKVKDLVVKIVPMEDVESTRAAAQRLQNTDTNMKRSLPDEESDVEPRKKQKSSNDESATKIQLGEETPKSGGDITLPRFEFGFNLILSPINTQELEKWLGIVDALKKENNWCDLVTINKVLERLKGLHEIYTWLSDISKILKWEEWKDKLIKVFPSQNDYYCLLKRMEARKKRLRESFVTYYNVKMELLKPINVTGESAVSCLLGGLKDVSAFVARAGNYKNPEQLLAYFKICDDKEKAKKSLPPVQPQKKRQKRCSICKRRSHTAQDCPNNRVNRERQNEEKGKDSVASPQNRKTSVEPPGNSAISQKRSEMESREKVVASINTKTPTAVLPEQSNNTNAAAKQDQAKKSAQRKRKRKRRCHKCRKRSHSARDCAVLKFYIEHHHGEKCEDSVGTPRKDKANAVPPVNSATSQKQSEHTSSITTQDSAKRNEMKPQEKVVASITTKASTTVPPKQSKDTNVVSKQDQNGRTIEKQGKQNDDACFVKPQPPSHKSVSPKSQSEGSDFNKPIQKVSTKGPSSTKQSEGSAAPKLQNKENATNVRSSGVKTHPQSEKTNLNTTSSIPRNETALKGTSVATRPEQKKEDNNSNKYRSKPPDRSEDRRKPQSKENKNNVHPASGKTQSQSKESPLNRDSSRTRSTGHNRTSQTSTVTQERKRKDNLNEHSSRSQAGNAKTMNQRKEGNFRKSQGTTRGSNPSRDTFGTQIETSYGRFTDTSREQRGRRDYDNRHTPEVRKEDGYFNRYATSGSQRDTDRNYFNRNTPAATIQDRREFGYPDSASSMITEESYLDRAVSDSRSQRQYQESDVNRRPQKQYAGSYLMRHLSNAGFQESGDSSSIRMNESEIGYINKSNDRWPEEEEEERRGRYHNRDISRTRSPIREQAVNIVNWGSGDSRLQEVEVDAVNQYNIFGNRSREDADMEVRYVTGSIRTGSQMRNPLLSRPQGLEESEVNLRISSDRWQEIGQEGRYFNREGILGSRSPMRDERYANLSPLNAQPQKIEGDYVRSSISNDRWQEAEEQVASHYNRGILTTGPPVWNESSNVNVNVEGDNVSHSISGDRRREDEERVGRYINRAIFESRSVWDGRSAIRDPSDARLQVIEGSDVSHSVSSNRWREDERQAGSNFNRGKSTEEISTGNRVPPYASLQVTEGDNVSRSITDNRWQGDEEPVYANRGILPMQDERSKVDRGPLDARPQEIVADKVSHTISSDGWQENVEQSGGYVNSGDRGPSSARLQGIEGGNVNRDTFGIRTQVQGEESNLNKISSIATPPVVWESSYIDTSMTGVREKNKAAHIYNAAPTAILPAEKEFIGRSLRSEESRERSYLNIDIPGARPSDINYPNRVVAPTANPFSRSISSTRLLGSSLGSLFNLSLASRPFTSYPSCATTAKPLGLNNGSYFNRSFSHNRSQDYNARNRGAPGDINLRRGQEPTSNNYHAGLPNVNRQEQSRREICTGCYAVGHKLVDCPQLRT